MNHYSKLGTVFFRVLSISIFLFGFMGIFYNLSAPMFVGSRSPYLKWSSVYMMSSVSYMIAGLVLYYMAPILGGFPAVAWIRKVANGRKNM